MNMVFGAGLDPFVHPEETVLPLKRDMTIDIICDIVRCEKIERSRHESETERKKYLRDRGTPLGADEADTKRRDANVTKIRRTE